MHSMMEIWRLQATQPTPGAAVTAVWQSTMQIVSTPPAKDPKISAYSWWNCQATHNRLQIEINYYPDSLLFISAGFLQRLN